MGERGAPPPEETPRVTVRDRRRVHIQEGPPAQPGEPPLDAAPGGPEAVEGAPGPGDGTEVINVAQVNEDLSDDLAVAQAEAAGYLDDLQRLKAEFDNYRKRVAKEQVGLMERASATLVHRLLPVLDNFDLAVAAAEGNRDFDRMLRGIEMVFGELREVLAQEGLERIQAKGKPFDPNYHEAAMEVDGGEGEPHVADELRTGYLFKGRVLRPSMVKVARGS